MCRLTYAQIKKMHDDAYWAQAAMWELGCFGEAIRYCKIANRLYNAMMAFPGENILLDNKK